MKHIFVINGSAGDRSSNQRLIENFALLTKDVFCISVFEDLKQLPHFDPQLSTDNTPQEVLKFRESIQTADGILICTPEYIFSIPSGLKNALEWCVSTTVFSEKPIGIITASAHGEKGHKELQLIMQTLMAKFTVDTTLLIQGIKGKIDLQGEITDRQVGKELNIFAQGFEKLVNSR